LPALLLAQIGICRYGSGSLCRHRPIGYPDKGCGTHAAHPHLGIDPFVIGAEIVLALQTICGRNLDPLDSAVVSVGFIDGGSADNVIPDGLHIGGTSRSFRPEVRDLIERRIGEIARGVAPLHGASAASEYRRNYPPTITHPAETEFAADVAAEICGRQRNPQCGAVDGRRRFLVRAERSARERCCGAATVQARMVAFCTMA
jgi:metal-dependent amidase/aminoacylase/carboxypeptidase family protein